MRTPPNEQRNFVHKRIIRGIAGFAAGGPAGAALGFATGGGRKPKPTLPVFASPPPRASPISFAAPQPRARVVARPTVFRGLRPVTLAQSPVVRRPAPRSTTARPSSTSAAEKALGRIAKFGASDIIDIGVGILTDRGILPPQEQKECGFGRVWDEVKGKCVFGLGEQAGRDDTPGGDVVMGRYGAGEIPGNMVVNRAVCRPGMVIGDDGVCYNRSQLKNSEREWPRGRRPLLTGGDMRAISTAARAGRRLERTTKRLQKIGMMKKPAARARRLPPHQHQITSGGA